MNTPKTYMDAINQGYTFVFHSFQRGYVSRKAKIADLPVKIAGGKRKGMLYVCMPYWESTRYCVRSYLVKREA